MLPPGVGNSNIENKEKGPLVIPIDEMFSHILFSLACKLIHDEGTIHADLFLILDCYLFHHNTRSILQAIHFGVGIEECPLQKLV